MSRLVLSVALTLCGGLVASPAEAAVCFEFTLSPTAPRIGQATAIEVTTLWPTGVDRGFSLRIWAPDRSTSVVALTRVAGEERWRGTLVFDQPGTWALQAEIAHPSNEYSCFYKTVEVTAVPESPPNELAIAAGVGALVVAGLAAVFVRRGGAGGHR